MKKRYLFFISVVFLLVMACVNAQDNTTDALDAIDGDEMSQTDMHEDVVGQSNSEEKLETAYYYDANDGRDYVDDTVVTHNVVKYYGDKSTKFKVLVLDNDYYPESGVYVSFGKSWSNLHEKRSNANGNVYFPINYGVGKHKVITYIECNKGYSYYYAYNTVTVKSTIPTKTLTKYYTQKNKKFSVKFLDSDGYPLVHKKVKFKFNGKTIKARTNSKGIAKIKLKLTRIGKYKLTAYNPVTKEKRKIKVKITKKQKTYTVSFKLKVNSHYYSEKRLKTGDILLACANSYDRQFDKGVDMGTMIEAGQEGQHSTKMVKGKVWYKNTRTGKIVTKTQGPGYKSYNIKHFDWINGYVPYKAKVWYKHR